MTRHELEHRLLCLGISIINEITSITTVNVNDLNDVCILVTIAEFETILDTLRKA